MTEEQSGKEQDLSKTKNVQSGEAKKAGAKPDTGYWEGMRPEDSSDMSADKARFGVFEKKNSTGPVVAKPEAGSGSDVRPMGQSGIYAEKDSPVWKEMAKKGESTEAKDAEWCGTPSDESCEIVGAPTHASKRGAGAGEEETPAGKQGQHWKGEPWAKNPKIGGKETESGSGTSGQHWRGEDVPKE